MITSIKIFVYKFFLGKIIFFVEKRGRTRRARKMMFRIILIIFSLKMKRNKIIFLGEKLILFALLFSVFKQD